MNLLNSTSRLPYFTAYDGLHGIVGFGCVFHTLNRNYEAISSKILPLGRKINDFFVLLSLIRIFSEKLPKLCGI